MRSHVLGRGWLVPVALAVCVGMGSGCLAPGRADDYYRTQKTEVAEFDPNLGASKSGGSSRPPVNVAESSPATRPPQRPENAGVLPANVNWSDNEWKALLIGISDYSPSGGFMESLAGIPTNDVEALAGLLKDEYGFEVKTVLDHEATRTGILASLTRLRKECDENDNVLVYYAGHGQLPESQVGTWIPCDAKNQEEGISTSEIRDRLSNLPAKRVLLMSDSCFSGSFLTRGVMATKAEIVTDNQEAVAISSALVENYRDGREVITSGNLSTVPNAGVGSMRNHSPFAGTLLRALENAPRGSALGTTDLFVEVYYNMQRVENRPKTSSRPQRGTLPGHAGGEFFFVHRK